MTVIDGQWSGIPAGAPDPGSGAYAPVFRVINPSGDTTGATDTAAINAAINAAITAGAGSVFLSAGTFYVSSTLTTVTLPGISVTAAGSQQTFINPVAAFTGDVLRVAMNPWPGQQQAGTFGGFTINGTAVSGTATGLHIGDGVGYRLQDLIVENFTGTSSIGIHVDNTTHWTERMEWIAVTAANNTNGIVFDVNGGSGSWDYNNLTDVSITVPTGGNGVVFQGGGVAVGSSFNIRGNVSGSRAFWWTANAGAINCDFNLRVERDGGTPTGLQIDAGSTVSGGGLIVLYNGFTADTINGTLNFTGKILTSTSPALTTRDDTPPADPLPRAMGFLSWNYNPAAVGGTSSLTNQRIDIAAIYIPPGTTVTNIILVVETAGSGTTPTGFFVGLIAASPGAAAKMVAQSANLATSTSLTTTRGQVFPLSSSYVANPTDSPSGLYYVAILQNGAFGTTNVAFQRGNSSNQGYGIGGRPMFGNIGTGQTALPTDGTAVVISDGGGWGWFVALT